MTPAQRLAAVRAELAAQGLDGCLVPRADEHLGEYVPAAAERLAWLTGFTGSAGLAVVLAERAALFTDGRYQLQVRAQADAALYEFRHLIDEPPAQWLKGALRPGMKLGHDPWLLPVEARERYAEAAAAGGAALVAFSRNPIDAVWRDRPPPPAAPVHPHPLEFAGKASAEKRAELAAALAEEGLAAAIISAPDSLAWLLNLRGGDVPYSPLPLGFAILHADARVDLFMDERKLTEAARASLGNGVAVQPVAALGAAIAALGQARARVRLDRAGSPAWFADRLAEAGAEIVPGSDPCIMPKACKNAVEQEGARAAHRRDGAAMARFLRWLSETAPSGTLTEMAVAERLLEFRRGTGALFRGESFPAIAGAGPNGAIIHYRASAESNRALRPGELFLIDSGGQYLDATTDVTRTLLVGGAAAVADGAAGAGGADPATVRGCYTRVLKGHVAIARLCFPETAAGLHLDAFARAALWRAGLDYDHGTGHGVGSYLGVHEGPVSLSRTARPVPLRPGMILSDEPGYYRPGAFGIRIENLLLVRPAEIAGAERAINCFETLTLVPYDRALIELALLEPAERAWIDAYHARVLAEIGPLLDDDADRAWLAAATAPL